MKCALFLALVSICSTAYSQDEKAAKIYSRYVREVGGVDHWLQLQSYRRVSKRKDGLKVTSLAQKPDQFQLIFELEGRRVTKSYDGSNGWLEVQGRYEVMRPGEELEMAEEPEFYEDLVNAEVLGYGLSYEGTEKLGKLKCHKLKMTKSLEDEQWYWINSKNYRLEMVGEYSQDPAHDGIFYTTRFEDYRMVDGYLIPFTEHLIRNGQDTTSIYYSSMEINPSLSPDDFSYRPTSVHNAIHWLQDDFPSKIPSAYTFVQETIHFHDGKSDTSVWYEAIKYPTYFRIDFEAPLSGMCNLTVDDTMYAIRNHQLRARIYEPQLFLLFEGEIYSGDVDSLLQKMAAFHIDTTSFRIEALHDRPMLFFGNAQNAENPTELAVGMEDGLIRYQSERLEDGKILELWITQTQDFGDFRVPREIEFYLDGALVQRESYIEVNLDPTFPPSFFTPEHAMDGHWYVPK